MFQQMKNIDSAFRQIRLFCLLTIIVSCAVSVLCIFKSYQFVHNSQQKIFILANGKALEAYSAERKDNIPVEAKDHIRMFHHHFFTLDPDDEVIRSNVTRALYLADGSAKRQYDDLKEKGYYANLISGNISQQIQADSVTVDMDSYPYHFRYYGMQTLTRATSITTRSLITEGYLRNVSRSDNNPHGFLIEKWSILQNRDIQTKNR